MPDSSNRVSNTNPSYLCFLCSCTRPQVQYKCVWNISDVSNSHWLNELHSPITHLTWLIPNDTVSSLPKKSQNQTHKKKHFVEIKNPSSSSPLFCLKSFFHNSYYSFPNLRELNPKTKGIYLSLLIFLIVIIF
jgi:hypothetical protein